MKISFYMFHPQLSFIQTIIYFMYTFHYDSFTKTNMRSNFSSPIPMKYIIRLHAWCKLLSKLQFSLFAVAFSCLSNDYLSFLLCLLLHWYIKFQHQCKRYIFTTSKSLFCYVILCLHSFSFNSTNCSSFLDTLLYICYLRTYTPSYLRSLI